MPDSLAEPFARTRAPELSVDTPIGRLRLTAAGDALAALNWMGEGERPLPADAATPPVLLRAAEQLRAYFAGDLTRFDLPLTLGGTAFQQRVWRAIQAIPHGETASYGMIARAIGSGPRSVGGACGRNAIAVIIPCHRVLASDGIGGYSGARGLDTKRWLLRHEGVAI